jgi:LmbE family N-acetylglucosaminyl deacetylase
MLFGPQVDMKGSRVLVLAPHTDDEFGCAGTMSRLLEQGAEIRYVALSRCEQSLPAGLPEDTLERECRACLSSLGLAPGNVEVWRYPVRHFPSLRQEILERLVALNREYRPSLVLLPSSYDTHQDHATVHTEGFRAFKSCSVLGYELPQNLISFENSGFVRLEERHLVAKVRALAEYRSQGFRPYSSEEFMRSLAMVRGVQAGSTWAEAFEAVRVLM